MIAYDLLMLAVLIGCTLFGAWKGLAWQITSIAALVVSYMAALAFSDALAPFISDKAPLNRVLAMLILYIGASIIIWLLFRLVAGFIDRVKLKEFDRQLGAVFGAAKGVLFCLVITFFAVTLFSEPPKAVVFSRSGHYITLLIDHAHPLIPEEIHNVLHPWVHKLDEKLEHEHHDGEGHEDEHADEGDHEDHGEAALSLVSEIDRTLEAARDSNEPRAPDPESLGRMIRQVESLQTDLAAAGNNDHPVATSRPSGDPLQGLLDNLRWLKDQGSPQPTATGDSPALADQADEVLRRTGEMRRLLGDVRSFLAGDSKAGNSSP